MIFHILDIHVFILKKDGLMCPVQEYQAAVLNIGKITRIFRAPGCPFFHFDHQSHYNR